MCDERGETLCIVSDVATSRGSLFQRHSLSHYSRIGKSEDALHDRIKICASYHSDIISCGQRIRFPGSFCTQTADDTTGCYSNSAKDYFGLESWCESITCVSRQLPLNIERGKPELFRYLIRRRYIPTVN